MPVLWALSRSHGGSVLPYTLVYFLAGSCTKIALASGQRFTLDGKVRNSHDYKRIFHDDDIKNSSLTMSIRLFDLSFSPIINSTYELINGQMPRHRSSLREYSLGLSLCQRLLIAMCSSARYQIRKIIHHHTTPRDLTLEVLPTQSQVAYNWSGTVHSALLSSCFHYPQPL